MAFANYYLTSWKKNAKTSLSHITNMEEMNKSNKVITYIPSDLPMQVFVLLDNYD